MSRTLIQDTVHRAILTEVDDAEIHDLFDILDILASFNRLIESLIDLFGIRIKFEFQGQDLDIFDLFD